MDELIRRIEDRYISTLVPGWQEFLTSLNSENITNIRGKILERARYNTFVSNSNLNLKAIIFWLLVLVTACGAGFLLKNYFDTTIFPPIILVIFSIGIGTIVWRLFMLRYMAPSIGVTIETESLWVDKA